ncbi:MAG: TIM barrel protein, partial [Candidatus Firestonebacteria bacterium]
MIKAINYWSFPGGLDGTKDVKQAIKDARKLGYEGIELSFGDSGTLSPSTTAKEIQDILKTAKAEKIKLSSLAAGFYWAYNFASSKIEDRKKAVEMTKKYIDTAEALGVD